MSYWILIIVLFISFMGTWVIRKIAIRKNIMDVPNERSSHADPTPRGGGLAIVISWYLGLVYMFVQGTIEKSLFYALLPGSMLAIISIFDDVYSIKPSIRIFIQLLSVSAALYFLDGFRILYLGENEFVLPVILTIIAVIGAVWFINLYNFIDGIDAYASVQAILVSSAIFLVVRDPIVLLLILAVTGFLFWNWPKAKIFLGDVGSTQLGYILIILGIHFNNIQEFNFLGWMIITSLFWFDATLTLLRKWRNRENLTIAHKKHAYQRIVQAGFSHQRTVVFSIFINLGFIILVWISEMQYINYLFSLLICVMVNYLVIKMIDRRKPFNTKT